MMYTDNAPDYFYVILSILALALVALISLRLFDTIPRQFRRRRNTRRLWDIVDGVDNRLLNVEAELRDRSGDDRQEILDNAVRQPNTAAGGYANINDALDDELKRRERTIEKMIEQRNETLERIKALNTATIQGTTTLVAIDEGIGHKSMFDDTNAVHKFREYRCTNCERKLLLDVDVQHNFCPCCGLANRIT